MRMRKKAIGCRTTLSSHPTCNPRDGRGGGGMRIPFAHLPASGASGVNLAAVQLDGALYRVDHRVDWM